MRTTETDRHYRKLLEKTSNIAMAFHGDRLLTEQEWVEPGPFHFYYRRAFRKFDTFKDMHRTFELATFYIHSPARGEGYFRDLVTWIEIYCKYTLYVENLTLPGLVKWFERRGYTRIDNELGGPPCLYRATHEGWDPEYAILKREP